MFTMRQGCITISTHVPYPYHNECPSYIYLRITIHAKGMRALEECQPLIRKTDEGGERTDGIMAKPACGMART